MGLCLSEMYHGKLLYCCCCCLFSIMKVVHFRLQAPAVGRGIISVYVCVWPYLYSYRALVQGLASKLWNFTIEFFKMWVSTVFILISLARPRYSKT